MIYVFVEDWLCKFVVFFFKQKTAYEMRISDWSSDVCSSDLKGADRRTARLRPARGTAQRSRHFGYHGQRTKPDLHRKEGPAAARGQIGRASCRERVCQYV